MPASMALRTSSEIVRAVRAMIGMCAVAGADLICRAASQPPQPGKSQVHQDQVRHVLLCGANGGVAIGGEQHLMPTPPQKPDYQFLINRMTPASAAAPKRMA